MSEVIEKKKPLELKRKEFNLLDSAIACVAFIIMQLVFDLIYGNLPENIRTIFIVALLASLLVEAVFVFAVMITAKTRRVDFFEATTLNKKVDFVSILIALLLSLICLFSFTGLTNVFVAIIEKIGYSSNASLTVPNVETYLLYIVLICVCPAIFEDLLFRGCILNGLKKLGTTKAVIISALIFMLMHGGPDQTIHQFILGVVLGFALISSGSVWVPITIHFFNNFIALTTAFITRNTALEATKEISWGNIAISFAYAIIMAGIGAYLVYLCIKWLKKRKDLRNKDKETQNEDKDESQGKETTTLTESISATSKEKTEKRYTILLYAISGLYLVVNWVLALIGGLM